MGLRVVHTINGECNIFAQTDKAKNSIRIRLQEINLPDSDPADFEIEGNVDALKEVFSTLNLILNNIDALGGVPN